MRLSRIFDFSEIYMRYYIIIKARLVFLKRFMGRKEVIEVG